MLRPLPIDLAITALPFAVALAVGWLGWHIRRGPRFAAWLAGCLCAFAIIVPIISTRGIMPNGVDRLIAAVGGVTTIEAVVSVFLICVVWKAPKRSLSSPFLATMLAIAAFVIGVDNAGTLRWRLRAADAKDQMWTNRCDDRGLMRQSTEMTCAPTAAAMLLHRFGVEESEGSMAYRAGTSSFGTDQFELADAIEAAAARHHAICEASRETFDELRARAEACVAFIETRFGRHAVMVDEYTDEIIGIADPLTGSRHRFTPAAFDAVFTGIVIRLEEAPLAGSS